MDIFIAILVLYILPMLICIWFIRKDVAKKGYQRVDVGSALGIILMPFANILFIVAWLIVQLDFERIKKWLFLPKDLRNQK